MLQRRIIPVLLKKGAGLVKTRQFKDPKYLGDPINIMRIFNDKEVDEIAVLDIRATAEGRGPDYTYLERLTGQAFMPLAYGGGITSVDQIQRLLSIGIEKVIINTAAVENPDLISQAAARVGSQSVVVSIDAKKKIFGGYEALTRGGKTRTSQNPADLAKRMQELGAGEILIQSVDNDGMMAGYDLDLVRSVVKAVTVPVIACGGAGNIEDLAEVIVNGGVSSAAAGSMFVFHGKHKAVLVSYLGRTEMRNVFDRIDANGKT